MCLCASDDLDISECPKQKKKRTDTTLLYKAEIWTEPKGNKKRNLKGQSSRSPQTCTYNVQQESFLGLQESNFLWIELDSCNEFTGRHFRFTLQTPTAPSSLIFSAESTMGIQVGTFFPLVCLIMVFEIKMKEMEKILSTSRACDRTDVKYAQKRLS